MANTYKQAYFHIVFAVANRQALINNHWRINLQKYITGIVQKNGHKLIAIYAMPDHIHILIGYNLNQLIPDLVSNIKTGSAHWIKKNNFTSFKFSWQNGYGIFSHSHANLSSIIKYILNQEEHHKKSTFKEEYIRLLEENHVEFDMKYLYKFE